MHELIKSTFLIFKLKCLLQFSLAFAVIQTTIYVRCLITSLRLKKILQTKRHYYNLLL